MGAVVLGSFVWLLSANAVRSGSIEYIQDFEHRTPFVSDLWPPERINEAVHLIDGVVRPVVESPVSFFVHPPRKFETATISIDFKLNEWVGWNLALQRSEDQESFEAVLWDRLESIPGGFWRGVLTVPMEDWWHNKDHQYHAQLQVDNLLPSGNELLVREIRVELEGRPQGLREWINAFK
jgi:hypothetical protein